MLGGGVEWNQQYLLLRFSINNNRRKIKGVKEEKQTEKGTGNTRRPSY